MFPAMKIIGMLGAIAAFTNGSPADAFAQQSALVSSSPNTPEECVSIENDIHRLQCFDEAFAQQSAVELSPQDAFAALSELIESEFERLRITSSFHGESCALLFIERWNGYDDRLMGRTSSRIDFNAFNAEEVELESLRPSGGRGRGFELHMSRGNIAYYSRIQRRMSNRDAKLLVEYAAAEFEHSGTGMFAEEGQYSEETRINVKIATGESEVDHPKIMDAIRNVIIACQ